MIKDTFELFREPFDRASINRDCALERDSQLAAITARVQYLAQIVASVVSVPFLLLAGLYDLLTGNCNPCNIPLALVSQLFIILPISFFSAICPMSWSQGLDETISNCTRERKINNHVVECLPYLKQQLNKMHRAGHAPETIEVEDLQAAIRKKNDDLQAEALKKDFEQIQHEILAAPRGSPLQSDLHEMLKKKEEYLAAESRKDVGRLLNAFLAKCGDNVKTLDELRAELKNPELAATGLAITDTLAFKDLIEALGLKRANGLETPEALLDQLMQHNGEDPIDKMALSQAVMLKYKNTQTFAQLEQRILAHDNPPLQEFAHTQKSQVIDIMAACESLEALQAQQAERNNPIRVDLYANALNRKQAYLVELQGSNSFETLRAELAKTKNPVYQSDLTEAIIEKYRNGYCYYELQRLCEQAPAPVDTLLVSARDRRDREINGKLACTVGELEQALLDTAPPQAADLPPVNDDHLPPEVRARQHQDQMEALQRKYFITNSVQELEVMAAPDAAGRPQAIRDAVTVVLQRKKRNIQDLVNTKTFAILARDHNQEQSAFKKDILAMARDEKLGKIDHLCDTLSTSQLNEQHHKEPAGRMRKSDLKEALDKKLAALTHLVQNNTLEQLQERLAQIAEDRAVQRQDMTYAIQEKQRHLANAANLAAQQPAPANGAAATAVGAETAVPPAPIPAPQPGATAPAGGGNGAAQ